MSSAPPPMPPRPPVGQQLQYAIPQPGDAPVSKIIPYRNPMALSAYYLGLFSVLPVIGVLLAVPAFVMGLKGLKAAQRDPQIHGKAHAWIGIIGGGVFGVLWGGVVLIMIIAAIAGAMR